MVGMPGGGRRRPRPRRRQAEPLRWAAVACYAAALPLAAFGLARSQVVWFGAGIALLAGLWCQRTAALAARLEEQDEEQVKADVPGD
jgi:fatty acid desaturase